MQHTWTIVQHDRPNHLELRLYQVEAARYSVPAIPCPCCRRRLLTNVWAQTADSDTVDKYSLSARGLFMVKCDGAPPTHPHNTDCPPNKMALITSDCGETRQLRAKRA